MEDFGLELIKSLVRRKGNPVYMDTPVCKEWMKNHDNCYGCESDLGCYKVARLRVLLILSTLYEPHSFREFHEMHSRVKELQKRILNAQSIEELKEIPEI